jgi:hypothetical protein
MQLMIYIQPGHQQYATESVEDTQLSNKSTKPHQTKKLIEQKSRCPIISIVSANFTYALELRKPYFQFHSRNMQVTFICIKLFGTSHHHLQLPQMATGKLHVNLSAPSQTISLTVASNSHTTIT